MYYRIGEIDLLQSHVDEAIRWLEKVRNANTEYSFIHAFLAAAYGLNGEPERANHALFEATFFAGLRKAGMPEE